MLYFMDISAPISPSKLVSDYFMTKIAEKVITNFSDCLLAVRSSSSMEDMPGMAGAGLYDSVIGVKLEPECLKNALK